MSLTVSDSGGKDFQPAPAGTHLAICFQIVDLGTQLTPFMDDKTGKPKSSKQVRISWELCNELMEDGRPFVVSNFYTASLNEKANLRHHLDAWRGKAFTEEELKAFCLKNILGKPCMVSVTNEKKADGSMKSKIAGVVAVPKGMPVPAQVNPSSAFEIIPDAWDEVGYAALSDFLKNTIAKSEEYVAKFGSNKPPQAAPGGGAPNAMDDSDIPFAPGFNTL